jgi:hypothetical protein
MFAVELMAGMMADQLRGCPILDNLGIDLWQSLMPFLAPRSKAKVAFSLC